MVVGDIAYVRTGDKGTVLNVSVVPTDANDYDWLASVVTQEKVYEMYKPVVEGEVHRYDFPNVPAFNFVMTETLDGGVSRSLGIDPHGKQWGALLMELDIGERP
jgi:hypothetical protein